MPQTTKRRKTVDPKDRMRVSKACDRCKRQKIKCDGLNPCANCTKHQNNCQYTPTQPPPPNNNSSISKTNRLQHNKSSEEYISFLESRIKSLENRGGANQSARIFPTRGPNGNNKPIDNSREIIFFSTIKWRSIRTDGNILLQDLSNMLYNSLSQEDQSKVTKPRTQFYAWNCSGSHYINSDYLTNPLTSKNWKDLLHGDSELSKYFLNYFFSEINPLFAILHEPIFLQQYQKYLSNLQTQQSDQQSTDHDSLFVAMLYLIYAISMRYTEFGFNKKYKSGLEEKMFEIALEIITKLSVSWESFELVQGWLLIFIYLRTTHKQASTFYAISNAVRMVKGMSLDLHVIYPKTVFQNQYESIKAKRIFWAVYTLDKLYSLHSGRSFLIDDHEGQFIYPSWDFHEQNDGWFTVPALALLKLAIISKQLIYFSTVNNPSVLNCDYNHVVEDFAYLKSWCEQNNLWDLSDDGFHSSDEVYRGSQRPADSAMVLSQLKLHYYHSYLTLQSKALYPLVNRANIYTQSGMNKDVDFYNFDSLMAHCKAVMSIFKKFYEKKLIFTPWYLNLNLLFNVGVFSLVLINSGIKIEENRQNYIETIDILRILRHPVFRTPDPNKNYANGNATVSLEIVNNVVYEVTYQDKFGMCNECLYALKLLNRMMIMRNNQITSMLAQYTDHGPSTVNEATFTQFGFSHHVRKAKLENNNIGYPVRTTLAGAGQQSSYSPPPNPSGMAVTAIPGEPHIDEKPKQYEAARMAVETPVFSEPQFGTFMAPEIIPGIPSTQSAANNHNVNPSGSYVNPLLQDFILNQTPMDSVSHGGTDDSPINGGQANTVSDISELGDGNNNYEAIIQLDGINSIQWFDQWDQNSLNIV
ncbi:Stb4 protein [Saccharomycopsis crataegensis]|uniref:Stb4 protein n=1 Tax=Saccharomycopsis crataegensis TaxID=43959 RepID=A0AAV5QL90_9ASCO|nr:Stb4 protein [Saccharomycopsis crataegensis]